MADRVVRKEEIVQGLQALGLGTKDSLIVHTSLRSFGKLENGPTTLISAFRDTCSTILAPAFCWQTVYFPDGWQAHPDCPSDPSPDEIIRRNRNAAAFHPDLPTTPEVGYFPEAIRLESDAVTGWHPTHRFAAIGPNAKRLVQGQSPMTPLEPIAELGRMGGWILLLGVSHTSNTAIHLAEAISGRPQWFHWALTREYGPVKCITPSCSRAFNQAEMILGDITRETMIGSCQAKLLPVQESIDRLVQFIHRNPTALLCGSCSWCLKMIDRILE